MRKISKLTILFIISVLTANQIDTIINNILNNKKKYSEEELYSYIKKNQNDSSTLILNGLIEIVLTIWEVFSGENIASGSWSCSAERLVAKGLRT